MPTPDFEIKTGDSASHVFATLEDANGDAVDIQGSSILFKMGPLSGGTLTVAGAAVNAQNGAGTVDGSTGNVEYRWGGTAAIPTADWYRAEWEVTYSNGSVQSFPNAGYMTIAVTGDL